MKYLTYVEGKDTSFVIDVHCILDTVDIRVEFARNGVTLAGKSSGVAELGKGHIIGTGTTDCLVSNIVFG